jgi:hypothetical protein
MASPTMPGRAVTRLPIPHLFLALSIGIFAVMAAITLVSASALDGDATATGTQPDTAQALIPVAALWW